MAKIKKSLYDGYLYWLTVRCLRLGGLLLSCLLFARAGATYAKGGLGLETCLLSAIAFLILGVIFSTDITPQPHLGEQDSSH